MILQALKEYYDRKVADPDSGIAPFGWEWKEIPYLIVLDTEGNPVDILTTYEGEGKNRKAKRFLVPRGEKKTSGIKANLLWDNPEYVVGVPVSNLSASDSLSEEEKERREKEREKCREKAKAFYEKFCGLGQANDHGWEAVEKFLSKTPEEREQKLLEFPKWKSALEEKANLTFRLDGELGTVAESSAVRQAVNKGNNESDGPLGRCLVTNSEEPIELLHPSIKGVWGGNTSGTNIVGFNLDPFCSYGKKQGANAPVGKTAVFAYTTALNTLLDKDSSNRMQVGEASTVVWGEKATPLEEGFVSFFAEPPKDDPDRGVNAVKALFESLKTSAWAEDSGETRFYVLGLSPNAARLAIRFWIVSTVRGMSENIAQFFKDTQIVHGPKDRDVLSIKQILTSLAVEGKSDNIPPTLEGSLMRAILEKLPYPQSLLQAAVRRIRVQRRTKSEKEKRAEEAALYARAAIIKACLNRSNHFNQQSEEELKVALDLENKNIGYRLGRLFAALEKIQSEANSGLNATIRDRYYGAASGTPVTVFPNLMRLKNHHLTKLEKGRRIDFEQLLAEIVSEIKDFPRHLSMENQGRFAIGYYHQNNDFYTKKEDKEKAQGE